jgi:hypothetical protein
LIVFGLKVNGRNDALALASRFGNSCIFVIKAILTISPHSARQVNKVNCLLSSCENIDQLNIATMQATYTHQNDFVKTQVYLQKTLNDQSWKYPVMKSTLNRQLVS